MKAHLRDYYRRIKYFNSIPSDLKQNDLFLVEFPKSGVTWLSFIFANVIQGLSGIKGNINFFNFTQYVPDISYSVHLGEASKSLGFRIIKSHASYNPFYTHIIFLIRNPFNVMMSYYKFLTQLNIINSDFDVFLKHKKYGIEAWTKHTESWLQNTRGGCRLQMVRYEDLSKDTFKTMSRLFNTIGIELNEDLLKKSLEASSFENMKKSEKIYEENHPNYQLNFVRKGQVGSLSLNQDQYNYILNNSKGLVDKFWNDIDFKQILTIDG